MQMNPSAKPKTLFTEQQSRPLPPTKADRIENPQTQNPWTQILFALEGRIGPQHFATWLKPTTFSHLANGTLHVRVPSPTCKDWILEHYLAEIEQAGKQLIPPVSAVQFFFDD